MGPVIAPRPAGPAVGGQRGSHEGVDHQEDDRDGGTEFDRVGERESEELHVALERLADNGEMLAREHGATMTRAMCPPPPATGVLRAARVAARRALTRFERLGRWAARRRWQVVMAWIVLIGVAIPLALQTSGALRSGGFIRQDLESARAKQLLSTEIGVPEAAVALVLHSDTLRAGEPAFEARRARRQWRGSPRRRTSGASSRMPSPRPRSRPTVTRPTT